jgi:hypothetical protein
MTTIPARREAKAIAAGNAPRPEANEKVILYGLLARSLDVNALRAVELRTSGGFGDLEEKLGATLGVLAAAGYNDLGDDTIETTEELFSAHDMAAADRKNGGKPGPLFGSDRLKDGAMTGAHRVVTTLRTIARGLTDEHETISQEGLEASGRVPFKLAMLHLLDLRSGSDRHYMETWRPSTRAFFNRGDVFLRDTVTLNHINGLNFLPGPDFGNRPVAATSPNIGCPASLIRGYIETVFVTAAHAAQDMGLISAA